VITATLMSEFLAWESGSLSFPQHPTCDRAVTFSIPQQLAMVVLPSPRRGEKGRG